MYPKMPFWVHIFFIFSPSHTSCEGAFFVSIFLSDTNRWKLIKTHKNHLQNQHFLMLFGDGGLASLK